MAAAGRVTHSEQRGGNSLKPIMEALKSSGEHDKIITEVSADVQGRAIPYQAKAMGDNCG